MQAREAGKKGQRLPLAQTDRFKLVLAAAFALVVAGAVALAFLLGPSAGTNGSGASGSQITIGFTVPEGADGLGAPTNSPLEVRVRVPWRSGDNSTIFSGVGLEFLDESGNPATFGDSPSGPVEMKPALDVAD